MGPRGRRGLLLAASLVCLAAGETIVLLLARDRLWLFALPLLPWGGLFMAWAYLKLKDPRYYG